MRRRDFLKLVATSATGAVLFTGCSSGIGNGDPTREFQIESSVQNPIDVIYGRDNWYATAFPGGGSPYGVIVRVFEGRAKKVEGNPDFPTNRGATDARAQALVQEVYHPDRIPSPMKLVGPRGSGKYQAISWSEAMPLVTKAVGGASGSFLMITEPLNGPLGQLTGSLTKAANGKQVALEPGERAVLREAVSRVFGSKSFPDFDLANTDFLVSFSADFLQTWISPVQYSQSYGLFRQGRSDKRGMYYHVGPQLSGTAGSADKWLPSLPGAEGMIALSMAQVMTSKGLVDSGKASQIYGGINLNDYTPDKVASKTGLTSAQITDLATRFANGKPSVAIAGTSAAATTNALFNLMAVYSLNLLVDNVNKKGGVMVNPDAPLFANTPAFTPGTTYGQMQSVINDMSSGKTKTVVVYGANPVYSLPKASGFANALSKVSTIISLSSFLDETTMQADIILPVHTPLEAWDIRVADPGPGYAAVVLQQPVVDPFVDSRSVGDILIQALNGAGQTLPFSSYQDMVQAAVAELQKGGKGNIKASNPKEYMLQAQTQGGWWDDTMKSTASPPAPKWPAAAAPKFAGDQGTYPMYLLPYPHNTLGYGEYSHLPWLQGTPEPISTNVWRTWVEVSQHDSDTIGLNTGDIVKVKTPKTTVELPVYVNPAGQPGVVAIPFGQGHTAYTRYAENRGTNPLDLIDPLTDSETGALAWASTRVKLETTGRKMRLPRFEGQVPAFQLQGAPIVEVISSE